MGRHPVSVGGRADAAESRSELLDRLGLGAGASDQDVETAYNGVVEFLELAPHEVQSWAAAQVRDVDETFALLSSPTEAPTAAAKNAAPARPTVTEPAPIPTAASIPTAAPAAWRRWLMPVGVLLAAAAIFGVYSMGKGSAVPGISGTPTNTPSATAAAGGPAPVPVDKTKVGALMAKISANPKDIASLQSLGDIYFAAADYKTAIGWEEKILAVDPKNQVALLAAGAAQFNQGDKAAAKKHWLKAAALYPNVAEVHYDLGFLYLSQTPPDLAKATAEWERVIAIDPTSEVAKTVATHLKSLKSPAPSAPGAK